MSLPIKRSGQWEQIQRASRCAGAGATMNELRMSPEEKRFFLQLLDIMKRYHRQRDALFQILKENVENWEPVYSLLQDDSEIVRRADEAFAGIYAGIELGKKDSEAVKQATKDPPIPTKWRPN